MAKIVQEVQSAAQAAAEAVERLLKLTGSIDFQKDTASVARCHVVFDKIIKLPVSLTKEPLGFDCEKYAARLSVEIGGVKFFALATAEQLKQLEKANKKAAL